LLACAIAPQSKPTTDSRPWTNVLGSTLIMRI
jgi:hypothetical protein